MYIEKEKLDMAIEGIRGMFAWSTSYEGFDYWQEVLNKLDEYKRKEEKRRITKNAGIKTPDIWKMERP
jgi:hypothetical protein